MSDPAGDALKKGIEEASINTTGKKQIKKTEQVVDGVKITLFTKKASGFYNGYFAYNDSPGKRINQACFNDKILLRCDADGLEGKQVKVKLYRYRLIGFSTELSTWNITIPKDEIINIDVTLNPEWDNENGGENKLFFEVETDGIKAKEFPESAYVIVSQKAILSNISYSINENHVEVDIQITSQTEILQPEINSQVAVESKNLNECTPPCCYFDLGGTYIDGDLNNRTKGNIDIFQKGLFRIRYVQNTKSIIRIFFDKQRNAEKTISIQKKSSNIYIIKVTIAGFNEPRRPVAEQDAFISSPFAQKRVISGVSDVHDGIDVMLPDRTATPTIFAAYSGFVEEIGNTGSKGFGYFVVIKRVNSQSNIYGHLTENTASHLNIGKYVEVQEEIGKMGTTGRSTGIHLHYEEQSNYFHRPGLNPTAVSSFYPEK